MKQYTITIPTSGDESWHVTAATAVEARRLLDDYNRHGTPPPGRMKLDEESYGEWSDFAEWEIEEEEEP